MEDCAPVSTPLTPGIHLSKRDSQDIVDPALQRSYRMILGFTGFLVQMTRPDLTFSYAALSAFLACQGVKHLREAEHMLQYLRAPSTKGITYSNPGPGKHNVLMGWVDSDFACDQDTRKSVTGY
eukprot:3547211-Rhodomonas_salina.1